MESCPLASSPADSTSLWPHPNTLRAITHTRVPPVWAALNALDGGAAGYNSVLPASFAGMVDLCAWSPGPLPPALSKVSPPRGGRRRERLELSPLSGLCVLHVPAPGYTYSWAETLSDPPAWVVPHPACHIRAPSLTSGSSSSKSLPHWPLQVSCSV